jgi:signal recognition particle receptor subunit beta
LPRRAPPAQKNSKAKRKMVSINYASKDICCKIVFYGPGLSGKTTNLQYVHKKIPSSTRGELISLATDQDRTLYFDFLPVDIGKIHGFSIKFQLYTVPGQVYYNATRKLVLRGVDGLVFVADSQRSKMDENIESYQNLVENLEGYGYDIEKLPLVFQYNKRDLSDLSSTDELESILNPKGLSHFEAVATQGMGVFDTLKCISKLVLDQAKGKKVVPEREAPGKEVIMAESKPAQPERVDDLKRPISRTRIRTSVNLSPEKVDLSKEKGAEPIPEEKSELFSKETKYEPPLSEKREELETEKEEMVSGGLTDGREEKKVESEQTSPKSAESPTIISWSATKQREKSVPKGFFLWRFFEKLLNR